MSDTNIEWATKVWNPTRGCSRVSEGCRNCYAERQAIRHAGPGGHYQGLVRIGKQGPVWTGEVRLIPEKLAEPMRWRKPARIFVNSMSDLFHERLTDAEIAAVFGVMAACPRHDFLVLTKRAERMRDWFRWLPDQHPLSPREVIGAEARNRTDGVEEPGGAWPLPNVWLGVSVEDQATADERIPLLLETPAAIRWASYEPALGPVDFERVQQPGRHRVDVLRGGAWEYGGFPGFTQHSDMETLSWVIVGGESGPRARPFALEWAVRTVDQCREAGVACFVKQLGARPFGKEHHPDAVSRCNRCDCQGFDYELGDHPGVCNCRHVDGDHRWEWRLGDRKGGNMEEWPADLRVREFPRELC